MKKTLVGIGLTSLLAVSLLTSVSAIAQGVGQALKPLWSVDFDQTIDKVATTGDGTVVAFVTGIGENKSAQGFHVVDRSGHVQTSVYNEQGVRRTQVMPFIGKDNGIYIPSTKDNYSAISKYIAANNYQVENYVFQAPKTSNINGVLFSPDYRKIYVMTPHGKLSGSSVYALKLSVSSSGRSPLWRENIENTLNYIVLNDDGSQIYASEYENEAYLLNAEQGETSHIGFPQIRSGDVVQDDQGYLYGPMYAADSSVVKFHPFNNPAVKQWTFDSKQLSPSFRERNYILGLEGQLYESFFNKIYAIDTKTGKELFQIALPIDEGKNNAFTGKLAIDPQTGWAYTSYIQTTPEPLVSVIGFSPDGKQSKTLLVRKGKAEKMSAPAISNGLLYVSVDNTLYNYGLNGQTAVTPVEMVDIKQIEAKDLPQKPHNIAWEVRDEKNNLVELGSVNIDGIDPMLLDKYRWPLLVSEAINNSKGMLKAGVKNEADEIKPIASQSRNHLWLPDFYQAKGYTASLTTTETELRYDPVWVLNTKPSAIITKEGDDLPVGSTIVLSVNDSATQQKSEHTFTVTRSSRFLWAQDFAAFINKEVGELGVSAGEKFSNGNSLASPLTSQYRNKLWVKATTKDDITTSTLSVTYKINKRLADNK
ncbi:hypothetical protein BS639_03405 [Rouxiella silvae]|uniref:N-acetylglucosamine binding protein A domain-containing protein n=1 Tax=Rouxiella silvae TaxID=1646373 RepID=A0ABX3U527_9GAMM|nr:hypothetical protein [Rouxiella silvae]ORJ22643.1 hypothetical protein BS639_03405 [Rouxiella silvae]